jgi:large repetitive protein
MRFRSTLFVLFFAFAAALPSGAATIATVLIDADANAATGCAAEGTTAVGFEQALVTTVDGPIVTTVQRRGCSGSAFGAPVTIGGPWPAPQDATAIYVESRVPLADLGSREQGAPMRLVFLFTDENGTVAFTTLPDGSPIYYPKLNRGRRRSARPADGTQRIVIDGNIDDWARLEPLLDRGVHSVWAHGDASQLYFRFDLRASSEPPVAANDSYAVRQGKTLVVESPGVLENDVDPDGSALSATLAAPATHGSVTLAPDGSFVYLNDGTLAGDGFDYKASDGAAESNTARVTINVTPNAAPVAQDDAFSTSRGGALNVPAPGLLANDSDAEGDPLAAAVEANPARGSVTVLPDGSFIYTHNGSTEPSDSFTYTVSDGLARSAPASVTIDITTTNAPPVAVDDVFHVANGGTLAVTAPGLFSNDLDSDTPQSQWTMTVVAGTSHGVLTIGTGGAFTYVHGGSATSDAFTYRISDGTSTSNVATVTIVAGAANAPPVANADNYSTPEDTPLVITAPGLLANDTDAEGATLSLSMSSGVSAGTLVLQTNGSFVYTPDPNTNGTDSFTYRTSDGELLSSPATVTIAVTPVNDAPVVANDAYTVAEGGTLTIAAPGLLANDSDLDDATLTASMNLAPLFGTADVDANGGFTYVHDGSDSSSDSFTYAANDGALARTGTATITVTEVNDAPVAFEDTQTTSEDTPLTFPIATLLANDSASEAGQTIAFVSTSHVQHGTVSAASGNITFTPDANFFGIASFRYTIVDDGTTDGAADPKTAFATVTVNVVQVNDAPAFNSTPLVAALEDTLYTYAIAAGDVDTADPLTITATGIPAWLTLVDNGDRTATLSGTPSNAHVGSYPIVLTVSDGTTTATQPFTLVVANTNDIPTATDDAAAVTEDAATSTASGNVLANDGDSDAGDTLAVTPLSASGTFGTIAIAADGTFTYTLDNTRPAVQALAAGATATDVFNYTIHDAAAATAGAALTITVHGANDAPQFTSTAIETVAEDALYSYVVTTSDVDTGASLTLTSSTLPAWLTLTDNTLSGTPSNSEVGSWPVTLTVSDSLTSTTQILTIVVTNTNDTPAATDDTAAITEDAVPNTVTGDVLANDSDADTTDTLSVTALNATGTYGSIAIAADGTFTYTLVNTLPAVQALAENATVTDTFNYTIGDGNGGTANAALTITITGTNDAPLFTSTAITAAPEDALYSYAITTSDVDTGASLTLTSSTLPAWLTLSSNTLSGTPANANVGGYPITLTISDSITSADQTFTIVVSNTNDTPVAQNDTGAVAEDASTNTATGNVLTNDSDEDLGDALSVTPVNSTGTYGSVTIAANGAFTYTLDNSLTTVQALAENATVTDTFNYTIGDGNGGTASAALTITITGTNDAPTFTSTAITAAPEDALYSYAIATSDVDTGASLTLTSSTLPAWLTLSSNTLSGTPANANVGSYPITLTISDSITSTDQTFTIVVSNTNDTPVAQNDTGAVTEDASTNTATGNVLTNDSDEDLGDALSVTPVNTTGTYGSVTIAANGAFTYTLDNSLAVVQALAQNATVTDTFNYTIGDGNGGTASAALTVTITGTNDAPLFTSTAITAAPEDALYSYAITTSDVDTGASLTLTSSTLPAWLTLSSNTLSGTPANADVGSYPITLTISDSITSSDQTFTIIVSNTNDAPIAQNDTGAVTEDASTNTATGNVLTNDSDEDLGDALSVTPVNTTGTYGNVTIAANGDLTYTLDNSLAVVQALAENATVTDTFNYTIGDGNGGTAGASLTITITGTNDAPLFTSTAITAAPEDALYSYVITTTDVDSTATLTSSTLPAWLTLNSNTLSGTPTNAEVGIYPITLTIDDTIASTEQTFTIVVSNTNDAPVAQNDTGAVTEDASTNTATGNVLTNDSDEDLGDTLNVTALNESGTYGSVTIAANGDFTYTLDNSLAVVQALAQSATVTDTFTYTLNDSAAGTDTATLTVTITGTNDAPVFTSTAITAAPEDALYSYAITTTDVDSTATLTSSTLPSWLTLSSNTLSGTPTNAEVGSYPITLTIDDTIASTEQTFTIVVSNTNDAPVAQNDTGAVTEDASTNTATGNLLTNDSDEDLGDTLNVTALNETGTYGSVTIAANGDFTYTLDNSLAVVQALAQSATVTDTFTYTLNDSAAGTDAATLTVTITGTNDAPVFTSTAITAAPEDALYSYVITTTDVDSTATLTSSTLPAWLTLSSNTLSGTPTNAEVGSYPITLTIDDTIASTEQTFTIVVSNTNDAPVAQNDTGAVTEDAATNTATGNVLTNDSDEDLGDTLSVTALNETGTYGSVTIAANGTFTYTLDNSLAVVQALAQSATVIDTFTYTLNDSAAGTDTATLTITITGTNDAPTFTSTAITAATEDAPYSYVITTNDVDTGATLTLTSSTLPAWLTLLGGTLSGTPANANVGSYAITLTIDDTITTGTQTFTIVVTNTNDAPVANPDTAGVTEDAAANTATGNVLANDTEVDAGDSLTVTPVNANGTYGTGTIAVNGAFTYTLDNARAAVQALRNGHTVTDVFNYTATDTTALTSPSTLTVTITGANDAPIAVADTFNLPLAGTLTATTVLANDSDLDTVPSAQTLTATVVADNTAQGDLTFNADGTFTYVKTCGGACAQNSDSFTYRTSDGIANSNTVTVTINYNTPPVADNDTVTGVEDTPLTINASDFLNGDSDAQGIGTVSKIFVMTTPSNGTLSGLAGDNSIAASGGSMTFTPNADVTGNSTFTYQLEDNGGLRSTSATVTITLSSVNDAPFFTPGSVTINVNEDSGLYNTAWATNLRPGPVTATNESTQTLTFLIAPAAVKHDVNNPAANAISCTGSTAGGNLFCASAEEIGNTAVNRVGTTSNANLTFRTWANAYGSATFTAQLQDNGGVANGGVNVYPTTPVSVTVNVLPVNDPPSFSLSQTSITQQEDGGLIVLGGHPGSPAYFANTFNPGPNESSQAFVNYTVTADDPSLFAELSLDATTGQLRAKPAPNAFGSTTLRVSAKDNGGTANGGLDTLTKNVPFTYLAVNDRPSYQRGPDVYVAVNSGAYSQPWVVSASAGPANESAQVLTYTASNNNNALFSQQPTINPAGVLSFTPAVGASGSATVTTSMSDSGGTSNGGQNVAYGSTFVIVVGNVNTPPRFNLLGDVEVQEDSPETTITNFITGVSPGANASESAQTIAFTISPQFTQFTSGPTLVPNGANYDLKFTVAPNYGGQIQTITVTAKDNGGVAGGGNDTSTKTFRFTQHHVNDAPLFNIPASAPTVFSDSGAQTVTNFATSISAGPTEGCQSLTFLVTSNTNPSLFSAGPAIAGATGCSIPTGNLTYTTAPGQFGTATITVVLRDDNATPLNPDDDATSTPKSFTITVNQFTGNKNDAPTFTKGLNETILEDAAGTRTVLNWATNITQGGDDSGQTVSFTLTNTNNALFSTQPAVSNAGTLTYVLAGNAHGVATVTVIAKDNGGTGGGGVDTSASQQFTITVTPVNDAPTFTASNRAVAADAGPQTVANWISAFNQAAVGVTNESTQTVTFTISVVSTSVPDLFSAAPALTGSPARTLTFTAGAGQQGLATVSVTATDSGGTADGGANTSTQTFTISVGNVNDAPSFTKGLNQTVNEDSGVRTVTNWASNVSTGPADESAQNLNFIIDSNSDASLFSAGPTITRSGSFATLTFTPAANAFGTATIGVKVQDTGGTAFGGQDTSPVQTFDITINPINDRPTFDVPATAPAAVDNVGQITVSNFATNLSPGNTQESAQSLTFHVVTNSNTAMFTTQPAIAPNGTLTYTPAHFGTADITIHVKDNGGTASGGFDTSVNKPFKITVNAGDPPVVSNKTYQTHSGFELTIGAGDSPHRLLDGATGVTALTITSIPTKMDGAVVTVTNAATGTFKYDPAPGHVGTQTFTFRVCDSRTPARCTDGTATVTVTGERAYYVDDSAPAGGIGTIARPFQNLYPLADSPFNNTAATVFIFSGNYSTTANGRVDLGNKRLIGQGATGSFATLMGIVTPSVGTIPSFPTMGGTKPVIDGQVGVGYSPFTSTPAGWAPTIRGIRFTHSGEGYALGVSGSDATATITLDQVEIATTGAANGLDLWSYVNQPGRGSSAVLSNSSIVVPRNANAFNAMFFKGGASVSFVNTPISTSAATSTASPQNRYVVSFHVNSGGVFNFDANSPFNLTVSGATSAVALYNGGDFNFNNAITATGSGAIVNDSHALIWMQGMFDDFVSGSQIRFNGRLNLTTTTGYPHAFFGQAITLPSTLAVTHSNNTINATNTSIPFMVSGVYFDPLGVKWQTINMNGGVTGFDIDTASGPFTLSGGTIQNYSSGQCYRANDYLNPPSAITITGVTCVP